MDLSSAVAQVQDPVTGVWWQVLDQPNRAKNYLEASGSSMFTYALATGTRMGYLAPVYRTIAERAFDGIVEQSDLGGTAVFLAPSASNYVNGHILVVDGGWMAR